MTKGGIFLICVASVTLGIGGCQFLRHSTKPPPPPPPPPPSDLVKWSEAVYQSTIPSDLLVLGKSLLAATDHPTDGISSLKDLQLDPAFSDQSFVLSGSPDLAVLWRESSFPLPDNRITDPTVAPLLRAELQGIIGWLASYQLDMNEDAEASGNYKASLEGTRGIFEELALNMAKQQPPFGILSPQRGQDEKNPFLTEDDLRTWEIIDAFLIQAAKHPSFDADSRASAEERLRFLERASLDTKDTIAIDAGLKTGFPRIIYEGGDLPALLIPQTKSNDEFEDGDDGKDTKAP